MTMVNYLSAQSEDCPEWLVQENYSLKNFFESRTVVYPGSGAHRFEADGTPIEVFNRSQSAHCYFYIDHAYSKASVMEDIRRHPRGYEGALAFDREYSAEDLGRECTGGVPKIAALLLESPSISDHQERNCWHPGRPPADSESSMRLLVYQRAPEYGEDHGANRFALFLLGMEARTAYSWFYGRMFPNRPPFAIWLLNCMGDGAGGDAGFTDPQGRLYQAAEEYGLPEFLGSYRPPRNENFLWNGYLKVNNADYVGSDRREYSLWRKSE